MDLEQPIAKYTALLNVNSKRKCSQPIGNMRKKAKH